MTRKRAAVLAGTLAVLACAWVFRPGEAVDVTIPPGTTAAETASLLKKKGVVRSEVLFRAAAKLSRLDRKLRPGTYSLRRGMSMPLLLRRLGSGAPGVKVVIPEGFSARQIAERLEGAGICRASGFMAYVKAARLEGYLFPTTYNFEPSTSADSAAHRMREEFRRRIEAAYEAAEPKPRLALNQLVTLASIVEREAVHNEEKPMIAAVYLNRMRIRMRLEADPTVQYALGGWKKELTTKDLQNPSPYNTYVHYGLPPGPICSPGLESFRAAMNPAKTGAVYFVANNAGGHVFSTTHDEHLKAKKSFKRGQRELKRRQRQQAAANGSKMIK